MHWILEWLVLSLSFWLTARVVPGFRLSGLWDAVVVAAIFGIVNFLLGLILYYAIGIATLGLGLLLGFITHWIVNAILIKLTDMLSSRLDVKSFGTALIAALVMSVLGKVFIFILNHVVMRRASPGSVYL